MKKLKINKNIIIEKNPDLKEMQYLLNIYNNKDYTKVEKLAKLMTQKFPRHTFAWKLLAVVLKIKGNYLENIKINKKIINITPSDSEIHYNLGNTLKELGKFQESIECYKEAIKYNSNYKEAFYNLGNTLKELGSFDDAINCYKKAIQLNPQYFEAYCNLGNIYFELKHFQDALICYKKSVEISPTHIDAIYNLGNTFKELGQFNDAIICYHKSINLYPNFFEAYKNLGNIFRELNIFDKAILAYKKALEINPNDKYIEHLMAAINGLSPSRASNKYVEDVFDEYAQKFEYDLVNKLNYITPRVIKEQIDLFIDEGLKYDILDLGCGTGLAGLELSNVCKTLVGVDVSEKMLEKAKLKNIYTKLIKSDIELVLEAESTLYFDIIVSSDVFVYIGDLDRIFRGVHNALKKNGFFSFSVEALSPKNYANEDLIPDFKLNINARYSHSLKYLYRLCKLINFNLLDQRLEIIRYENGLPVEGHIVLLQKN